MEVYAAHSLRAGSLSKRPSLSNLLRGQLLFLLRPNPIFTAVSRDCGAHCFFLTGYISSRSVPVELFFLLFGGFGPVVAYLCTKY